MGSRTWGGNRGRTDRRSFVTRTNARSGPGIVFGGRVRPTTVGGVRPSRAAFSDSEAGLSPSLRMQVRAASEPRVGGYASRLRLDLRRARVCSEVDPAQRPTRLAEGVRARADGDRCGSRRRPRAAVGD